MFAWLTDSGFGELHPLRPWIILSIAITPVIQTK